MSVVLFQGRGQTALMVAAWIGQLEICRLLIDRGCKIDITSRDGYTALHLAAQEGYLQTTRCLVEQGGASPLVTTHQGKTPYDLAAAKLKFDPRYKELVEYLQNIRDISESILTKLTQLNRDDFQDLVALGTFSSYENRVFLAGPCNIGKSSLASILIDEAIPKTWYSTDGLVIHFGRNGIDLQHRKMIPLKKGSGDILTKLLLGNPELKEQQIRPVESQIEQNVDKNIDKVPGDPKSNLTTNESKLNPSNMDNLPPKQQRQKNKAAPEMTSSDRQQQIPIQTSQKTLKGIQEQPSHTAHSIQDDLMEKIKEGTYIMKIAPSDLVDFGGQRSFDMTHQLFIQHRGTFILMFDGRLGLYTELEEYPQGDVTAASILVHWINSILTYCTKSVDKMPRIVFAATHSDSFSEDEKNKLVVIFQEELTKMFSSHKLHEHILYDKVFFINATDEADEEIGRLKDKLVDIAFQQSTWGQQMPIVWVPLDLQISDMRTDGVKLITKEKLLEMNKNNKEFALSERRVEDFLLVQHSIGKLLYFNEPALRDFIVIQPSAMVNILRAFITDRMFWPENGPIRNILENLSSTGVLTKTNLFTLWLQPAFKNILMSERMQEYVVQVLLHLDILVEPKHYAGKDVVVDLYLVPCIVASKFPPKIQNAATDDRTICIAYHLKETVVPSALSFKLIGAAISIWPLKKVDARYCLYYQAAVMDTDTRNELQIHVKGHRIVAYLVNDTSKHLISPDLATTIQECLTLALGRILKFYGHCFGRENHYVTSDLFEIEVGEVCKGETCLIPLSDAKTKAHWRCKNGKIHNTKFPLNWVVDKNKKQCDSNCKGLETEAQLLTPDDQHFVQLARTIGIGDFYNFFIELGMEKADYDNLNFRYFSNPMDFMLMGLFEWRDKTESDQLTATFGKLQKALTAIERQHYLCQLTLIIYRKAHSRLQDVPSDDVIDALTDKNLIGDCVVHLGVELCLSIGDIKKTLYNFPRDLNGQVHDLLTKWKNCNEIKMVKPTIYRLMVALQHIKAAKGLSFVKKTYGVE
ncbi:RIPK4 [Mytilus edulis]|uniref:RIPK4 n=1 Tax=Mytilus edulis TaxID=6550 RepID=A0A8S3TYM0_MYTED|nr:RIPK4 [Mytilus edulis]